MEVKNIPDSNGTCFTKFWSVFERFTIQNMKDLEQAEGEVVPSSSQGELFLFQSKLELLNDRTDQILIIDKKYN